MLGLSPSKQLPSDLRIYRLHVIVEVEVLYKNELPVQFVIQTADYCSANCLATNGRKNTRQELKKPIHVCWEIFPTQGVVAR